MSKISKNKTNDQDIYGVDKLLTFNTVLGVAAAFTLIYNVMADAKAHALVTDQVCQELNEKKWGAAHDVIVGKIAKIDKFHKNTLDKIRCENGEYVLDLSMLSSNEELRKIAVKNIKNPLQLDQNKLTYMDKAAKYGDFKSFKTMHIKVNDSASSYKYDFVHPNESGFASIQHIVDGGSQQLFDYALDHVKNPSELSETNPELVKYVKDHGTDGMKRSLDQKTENTQTSMVVKTTNSSDNGR